jgi:hypothetical protein
MCSDYFFDAFPSFKLFFMPILNFNSLEKFKKIYFFPIFLNLFILHGGPAPLRTRASTECQIDINKFENNIEIYECTSNGMFFISLHRARQAD